MKKILVPIKRVPDWQLKLKPNSESTGVDQSNIKWIVNTFDEIAVEEALRIRDAKKAYSEVVLVCIGPAEASEQIRSALAMGADRAIHVLTTETIDSEQAAKILSFIVRRDSFDLVILGKQAIDTDSGQTGQRMSVDLGFSQACFASKIDVAEDHLLVVREIDGGLETLKLHLPAIVTTDLRLNEPRLRSLPGIVAAKKKPVEEIQLSTISGIGEARVVVKKIYHPPSRAAGKKVENVDELVKLLSEEAKIFG